MRYLVSNTESKKGRRTRNDTGKGMPESLEGLVYARPRWVRKSKPVAIPVRCLDEDDKSTTYASEVVLHQ